MLNASVLGVSSKLPTKEVWTFVQEGMWYYSAVVINGTCSLYIDLEQDAVPTVEAFSMTQIFQLPEGYRPIDEVYVTPQRINEEGKWKGVCFYIKPDGNVYLYTRYAAISPVENSCRAFANVMFKTLT